MRPSPSDRSRYRIRSSPSTRTLRTGFSSSCANGAIGIQYRRISSPHGVPGPTRVKRSFMAGVITRALLCPLRPEMPADGPVRSLRFGRRPGHPSIRRGVNILRRSAPPRSRATRRGRGRRASRAGGGVTSAVAFGLGSVSAKPVANRSSARTSVPGARRAADSKRARNSSSFPGQSCSASRRRAAGSKPSGSPRNDSPTRDNASNASACKSSARSASVGRTSSEAPSQRESSLLRRPSSSKRCIGTRKVTNKPGLATEETANAVVRRANDCAIRS